jgi:orotate phosphoribosyltransferase
MLCGPAYKGIPLASAVVIAFAHKAQRDVPYCFNRKVSKDHGEGGITFGAPLRGRVLIIDDAISTGTSVDESVDIIRAAGATAVGVAVALDCMERGSGESYALEEMQSALGLKICSNVTMQDLVKYLYGLPHYHDALRKIGSYLVTYGNQKAAPGACG